MTGPELRACRQALGLTQGQLAAHLGVHWVTVARWEAGTREIAIPGAVRLAVELLAQRLGRSVLEVPRAAGSTPDAAVGEGGE